MTGPNAAAIAAGMPEVGDSLNTRLVELWRDPTVERCESVAASLLGARSAVLQLRQAVISEDEQERGHGQ